MRSKSQESRTEPDPTRAGSARSGTEYVAFDFETTGLLAETDRIVEVGAVRFGPDGEELGRFQTLVNPGRAMSPSAQRIHGISDADLRNAPRAGEVLPYFLDFLDAGPGRPTTLVAHNAAFDAGFLGRELGRLNYPLPETPVVDTLALARKRHPDFPTHRLDALAQVFGLDTDGSHRALSDSLRVKGLWFALKGHESPPESLTAYPVRDAGRSGSTAPTPVGWDLLVEAMTQGWRIRMEYSGGSRGPAPRFITPRSFVHKGGTAYLVALCHLDAFEKSFRLDRVTRYEVVR